MQLVETIDAQVVPVRVGKQQAAAGFGGVTTEGKGVAADLAMTAQSESLRVELRIRNCAAHPLSCRCRAGWLRTGDLFHPVGAAGSKVQGYQAAHEIVCGDTRQPLLISAGGVATCMLTLLNLPDIAVVTSGKTVQQLAYIC